MAPWLAAARRASLLARPAQALASENLAAGPYHPLSLLHMTYQLPSPFLSLLVLQRLAPPLIFVTSNPINQRTAPASPPPHLPEDCFNKCTNPNDRSDGHNLELCNALLWLNLNSNIQSPPCKFTSDDHFFPSESVFAPTVLDCHPRESGVYRVCTEALLLPGYSLGGYSWRPIRVRHRTPLTSNFE